MKRACLLLGLILLCLAAALAEPFTVQPAGLRIDLPAGWALSEEDGHYWLATDASNDAALLIFVVDNGDREKYVSVIYDQVTKQAGTTLAWQPERTTTVNGLPAMTRRGTGKLNDPAQIYLAVVEGPKGKTMLVLGSYATVRTADFKSSVEATLASIRASQ
jgi:hypothetical protein